MTYPTVVSDTTAHQNPWGDPIAKDGEKYSSFSLCSWGIQNKSMLFKWILHIRPQAKLFKL